MISRNQTILAAILAGAAAVPMAPASAQYGPGPSYSPSAPPPYVRNYGPPPGYYDDEDDVAPTRRPSGQAPRSQATPGYPREADADLPPPGFANPDPRNAPGYDYGYRYDRPTDMIEGQPPRPPGAVGSLPPGAVPPQGYPQSQPAYPQQGSSAAQQGAAPTRAPSSVMQLPDEDQPETGTPKELPANLKKQLVDYPTREPAGTIIIDTPNTYLYLVMSNGKAMRYGIGVGREGFTWAGAERISKMTEWPDWHPPSEMIDRQPYLPRFMAGGPGNPLGARALYLGKTLYRIHGTNQPSTIGQFVSSGCIRLLNQDIEDLYSRVQVGTRVVVMPNNKPPATASADPMTPAPYQYGAPRNANGISSAPLPPVR